MVVYGTTDEFEADIDEVLACFGYRVETQSDFDFDNIATSPPGDGCFSVPGHQSPWFIGGSDDYAENPGPAVHTLNVFVNAKKGGNTDVKLDRQFSAHNRATWSFLPNGMHSTNNMVRAQVRSHAKILYLSITRRL